MDNTNYAKNYDQHDINLETFLHFLITKKQKYIFFVKFPKIAGHV